MIFARCADFHLTDKVQRDRQRERWRERERERETGRKRKTRHLMNPTTSAQRH